MSVMSPVGAAPEVSEVVDPLSVGRDRQQGMYGLWPAMAWVVALRAFIFCVGVLSLWALPEGTTLSEYAGGTPWISFDAVHYLTIARDGYPRDEGWPLVAYFPLLPVAAKALSTVMPLAAALVLIANLCSLAGSAVFYTWARRMSGHRAAFFATLCINCFTGGVFFNAGMTEGPFFLLVSGVLLMMQSRRFFAAAVLCGIASLARPTALAVVAVMVLYSLQVLSDRAIWQRLLLAGVLGLIGYSGAVGYNAWLAHTYGDWQIYSKAQKTWEIGSDQMKAQAEREAEQVAEAAAQGKPIERIPPKRYSLEFFKDRLVRPQAWNYAIAAGLLVLTLLGLWKGFGVPRILYLLPLMIWLLGALPNKGLRISSLHRYEMGGVPLFLLGGILLARWKWTWARWVVLVAMIAVQTYYAWLFQRGIWIG